MITFVNNSTDPFYNQAFEEHIFNRFREQDIFFLWQNSPAVIVGQNQNIYREVDFLELKKRQIPAVRRMSGGGTVYHDLGNVNYTFISDSRENLCYDDFLSPITDALCALGINARKNNVCDIAVEGMKISGSAQRTSGGRVLHHGTLLFDCNLSVLDFLTAKNKNSSINTKGTLSTVSTVTNISRHLKSPMTVNEFKEYLLCFVAGGAETAALEEQDFAEIERLKTEKYQTDEWTWGKTPSFKFEKSGLFEGKEITVKYFAKRGVISEGSICCDALLGQSPFDLGGKSICPRELENISRQLCQSERLLEFMI